MIRALTVYAEPTQPSNTDKPIDKAQGSPLKVYILAGQSNMQGKSQVSTIPRMALSPETKQLHDAMMDENGEPKDVPGVSIVYFTGGRGVPDSMRHGLLKAGRFKSIGPEMGFGVTMDKQSADPILIIKVAWGGKSLRGDFRPPSAERLPIKLPRKAKSWSKDEVEAFTTKAQAKQGEYYRRMMKHIKGVLSDPAKFCPSYNPKRGYKICGFAWFQGFNDIGGGQGYYGGLLATFIRDVRKDLKTPKMPFAIGVIGLGGPNNEKLAAFQKAMAAPATMPEFKGNVVAVQTSGFWDVEMLEAIEKAKTATDIWDGSPAWSQVGKPTAKERIWHCTSFDPKKALDKTAAKKGVDLSSGHDIPDEYKDWLKPDFDTSNWQKGPAPIGKGSRKKRGRFRSPWGEGSMILMKTTFTNDQKDISHLRLCVQSTSAFVAYLNGHPIKKYLWWKSDKIRKFDIDAKYLKHGENELAFYGNVGRTATAYNAVDMYLEGLPKDKADTLLAQQAKIATPRDHGLAKGKSNQAYHYLGSAYTYSLIGEALAKAIVEMNGTDSGQR